MRVPVKLQTFASSYYSYKDVVQIIYTGAPSRTSAFATGSNYQRPALTIQSEH